jgi:class 3 adenylate cyclase/pimeloyl-ACP methyl ester carboxylesterase
MLGVMVQPGVQYVTTSDGVSIAYASHGEGPTVIYMRGPPFSHIQQESHYDNYRNYNEAIGQGRRLVTFDSRGTGMSDRNVKEITLDALTLDLEAVVDRLRLDTFVLDGVQAGGPIAVQYAARHPDRVSHLVLMDSYPSGQAFTAIPQVRGFLALAETDWTLFTDSLAHYFFGFDAGEPARRYAEFLRTCVDPEMGVRFFQSITEWDVTPLLPSITIPTTVVQHSASVLPNVETARFMASRLPNCELIILEGWWNTPGGDAQDVGKMIDRITGQVQQPWAPATADVPAQTQGRAGGLVTILFTDIEGSTALTQRLGDARAREVFREHERITREALASHGGSEVKTMGDGFMASFGSASGALECAIAMQRALAAHNANADTPISVRIGLNAGEPIAEEEDLFGTAVITASRIAAQAKGGEVLVSNVVRELVAGRGFMFADRGETVLRGFEDPARIYEVRWRE